MGIYNNQQHGIEECMVFICMINTCIYMVLIYTILTFLKKKKNICDWIINSRYYSPSPPINWQTSPEKKKNKKKQQGLFEIVSSASKSPRSDDGSCNNCRIKSCSSSSSSYMYMFISLVACQGFVLYRMDPLYHLQHKSCDLNNLCPLLLFPFIPDVPNMINCIKLGSKLYFFGLDYYFASSDSTTSNVYTFEEKDFLGINPSEYNNIHNFRHLFTKTKNPMHGPKYEPTLFVANHKLYALSPDYRSEYTFEVFSPFDETWQLLPTPFNQILDMHSFLVLEEKEQMVYFGAGDVVFSFNLKTHKWTTPQFRDTCPYYDKTPYPYTFLLKPVSIIGDMAFGFQFGCYICASHTTSRGEELMQPNLAPDRDFLEVLRSSRFTYMDEDHSSSYSSSDYLVALQDLDGKQVLCVVTYGIKPLDETDLNFCTRIGYVALSFFDIPGDFYTLKDSPVHQYNLEADISYAHQKAEDGGVSTRYFNAKFRHTAHFIINNTHLFPQGKLASCFF